ncbi:MAG TPA: ribosome biogenesis GTP-binding protein YihA/YsxC [Rhizomicrobium sp.]|nr:ribosome biogenesis GTP-binding protein YihA/YsxC [Rhizomicrobium sp.]
MPQHDDKAATARKLFAQQAVFIAGAPGYDALPKATLPEIAFVGRSNVGKSSLINALTGRSGLARVSKTPGRTRQINLFNIGDALMLADLPGYGFAKASKTLVGEWQHLIVSYLGQRPNLRRVLLLIDARRGVMPIDEMAMKLLDRTAVPYNAVLTKIDAIKPAARAALAEQTQRQVTSHPAALAQLEMVSADSGEGMENLKLRLATLAGA